VDYADIGSRSTSVETTRRGANTVPRKTKPRKTKSASPSAVSNLKPLVTDVRGACQLLNCGHDQIYDLLHAGEIESYLDGRARRIVIASLDAYGTRRRQSSTQFQHARYPVRDLRKSDSASA
jgi:excisionase family DNA binding protein